MSTFKNKTSLKTIEGQIVQNLKSNEARPKLFAVLIKKNKRVAENDDVTTTRPGSILLTVSQP